MEGEVITACENICRDLYWVGPVTEWLRNVAIIAGVLVAWFQLSAWRREHLSKRKAETAELLLSRAMNVKLAISSVRSVMEDVPFNADNKQDAAIEIKWKRLQSYNNDFDRLRELQVLHEALVGTEAVKSAVDQLFDVRQEIYAALATLSGWALGPDAEKDDVEFYRKLQRRISATSMKNDEFVPKVNSALEVLRTELLPEIRMQR